MKSVQKTFFALGTVNTITIWGDGSQYALQMAKERVLALDDRLSVFKPDSEISRINCAAGREFIKVHPDTFRIIETAIRFSELSDGAFDITSRPITALWGIGKKGDYIPTREKIIRTRELVGYKDILLDHSACAVMLKKPYQALDLGGIAKGYAADEVRRILLKNSVMEALINLGGTVIALGMPIKLGIQHPMAQTGTPMGTLSVTNTAAVTSGANEKYFIKDKVRYHHILDPRTGSPANSGLMSITLIGENAMALDAAATAVFVLGISKSLPLLERCGMEGIFVAESLDVLTTAGVQNKFSLLKQ
ncbi:MAG: FAD:protein FMN transferase [Oscillospiraceae bacterium]